MLKYENKDGEMVLSDNGDFVRTADLLALSVSLDKLHDRLKEMRVMYPVNTVNNEIFRDVILLIEDIIEGVK